MRLPVPIFGIKNKIRNKYDMRKLVLFILLLFSCHSFAAEQQDSVAKSRHRVTLYGDMEKSVSPRQHGLIPIMSFTTIGIEPVRRLTIGVSYIGYLGLYKDSERKTYYQTQGIGGECGWQLFKAKKDGTFWDKGDEIDIRARYGHSIGGGDLKYDLYDAAIIYRYMRSVIDLSLAVGYRFINSHSSEVRNHSNVYLGIGIGI